MTRKYQDTHGRIMFVASGISRGDTYATYYTKATGAMKRHVSRHLPLRSTRDGAQADLDAHAQRKGWQEWPPRSDNGLRG